MPIEYLFQLLLSLCVLSLCPLHIFQPPLFDGIQLLLHLKFKRKLKSGFFRLKHWDTLHQFEYST